MVYAAEIGSSAAAFQSFEGTELATRLEICRNAIQEQKAIINPKLHIAGRIHHIMTLRAPNGRKYTVIDTCGPDRFTECCLRPNMALDHMPDRYERGLEEAYITLLLHELEERQDATVYGLTSLQQKILSVISLINSDSSPGAATLDNISETSSGRLFPVSSLKSTPPLPAQEGEDIVSSKVEVEVNGDGDGRD